MLQTHQPTLSLFQKVMTQPVKEKLPLEDIAHIEKVHAEAKALFEKIQKLHDGISVDFKELDTLFKLTCPCVEIAEGAIETMWRKIQTNFLEKYRLEVNRKETRRVRGKSFENLDFPLLDDVLNFVRDEIDGDVFKAAHEQVVKAFTRYTNKIKKGSKFLDFRYFYFSDYVYASNNSAEKKALREIASLFLIGSPVVSEELKGCLPETYEHLEDEYILDDKEITKIKVFKNGKVRISFDSKESLERFMSLTGLVEDC